MSGANVDHPMDQEQQRPWMLRWASEAPPRTCNACGRVFQPNHPRRRYCGQPDCPGDRGRTRRATGPGPSQRELRARQDGVRGILADVVVDLNRPDGPVGSAEEMVKALTDYLHAERNPAVNPSVPLMRLMAVAAARMLLTTERSDPPT